MRAHRLAATALLLALSAAPAAAQDDALVAYKSLSPETALELAQGALAACRQRGFQVAVAVVDRFAGPHTPPTATSKAWTAVTFRTSTMELAAISRPDMPQAGLRVLPGVTVLGGGIVVEAGGALVGGIGVSGAPGGDADEACAKAGLEAIKDKIAF